MNYQSAGVSEISGSETGTSIAGSSWLPQRVLIRDGRRASKPHTLDAHGFALLADAKALHPNYYDETAVVNGYYEDCESLLAKQTGAKLVVAFDHNVRCDAAKATGRRLRNGNRVEGAAALVHNDYTAASAKRRLSMLSEPPSRALKAELVTKLHDKPPLERHVVEEALDGKRRFAFVNVWRPIVGPVTQWPLALLDARTVSQEDVHPTILNIYDNSPGGQSGNVAERGQDESELKVHDLDGNKLRYRIGEVLQPLPDPQHSWHVFPEFDVDECLLLKIFDSRRDGRTRFNAHCAVFDELGDPSAHRQSIEVRCLVLLNNGQDQAKL